MNEKELLERALSEINGLRNKNNLMAARLDMFDAVMSALHGTPAREGNGLMHPDIAYEIQKHLSIMEKADKL
jgi:hypothetical protein